MKFEVTILGSSSATPIFNRNPTAQLLNSNDHYYLIDCGEGTQQQLIRYGYKASKIDNIFISHLHGDHFFGLVGLLSSLHLNGRTKELNLFGPEGLMEILELQFKHSDTRLSYTINYKALKTDRPELIFENKDIEVETIILNHRIPCTGFKFKEKKRLRKLNQELLKNDHIPVEYYNLLKNGVDFELPDGRKINHQLYSSDSATPRTYCYCSDTKYDESYFSSIEGADLLYHEATFMHNLSDRALETHHTTAKQAAEVARRVGAKKLLIGHFSSRYKSLDELYAEAKFDFDATYLAIEGRTYEI